MKSYISFIFALMFFAAAMPQMATAQKTNRNWLVFTGYQTTAVGRDPIAPKYSCESSGIYATANFAAPVDLADGFYVTLAEGNEIIIQQKMTVDDPPEAIRSIPVDLVPDDDADLGFPDASLAYSRKLLTELDPGVHRIKVAVSVGEGDEEIAFGTFTFDNRSGCEERFARVNRLINGTVTGDAEAENPKEESADNDTDRPSVPTRPQPNQSQPQVSNYVTFVNECSEDRYVSCQYPDGTFSTFPVQKNFPYSRDYPVGTKFWNKNNMGGEPFFVLPASRYTGEMDKARAQQSITICQ